MVRFKDAKASEVTLEIKDRLTVSDSARMVVLIGMKCISSSDLPIKDAVDIVRGIPKDHKVTVWEFAYDENNVVECTHIDFGKQDSVLVNIVFNGAVNTKVEGWAR